MPIGPFVHAARFLVCAVALLSSPDEAKRLPLVDFAYGECGLGLGQARVESWLWLKGDPEEKLELRLTR